MLSYEKEMPIVTKIATRPDAVVEPTKDRCFYCGQILGIKHLPDCVLVSRIVEVEYHIKVKVRVPYSWDETKIEGYRNNGSWCSNNVIDELVKETSSGKCLCNKCTTSFLREVTTKPFEGRD
jgi:hypothetical protein